MGKFKRAVLHGMGKKCAMCRNKFPKTDHTGRQHVSKFVRMEDRSIKEVCTRCYSWMGRPKQT